MEIAEFLLARISDDEARVTLVESAPPKWTMTVYPHDGERIAVEVPALTPARVLAECEAKRRIVGHHSASNSEPGSCLGCMRDLPCPTLYLLAAVYSDHPDYQPEWKP